MKISTNSIQNGYIQDKYGSKGICREGVPIISFPLSWTDAPQKTESLALVFQDYDNVPVDGFSWIHWLVADIPGNIVNLAENASREDDSLIQGTNTWMTSLSTYHRNEEFTHFYGGPAPGSSPHTYEIRLYALDCYLNLKKGFYYNELLKKMNGHVLAEATIYGRYVSD